MPVDAAHSNAVATCQRCAWRDGPFADKTGARVASLRHMEAAHTLEASAAIEKARQRERQRGLTT